MGNWELPKARGIVRVSMEINKRWVTYEVGFEEQYDPLKLTKKQVLDKILDQSEKMVSERLTIVSNKSSKKEG